MRIHFNGAARIDRSSKPSGEEYQRRAEVVTIGGLLAHAGQDMLTQYTTSVKGQAKQIILVRGEPDAATAFQERLRSNGLDQLIYP